MSAQAEIFKEFNAINDISEALNLLKIAINYAIATNASRNEHLSHFMKKIYMDSSAKSLEAVLRTNVSQFYHNYK